MKNHILSSFFILFISFGSLTADAQSSGGTAKSKCSVKRDDEGLKKSLDVMKKCGATNTSCISDELDHRASQVKGSFQAALDALPKIFSEFIRKQCQQRADKTGVTMPSQWIECWQEQVTEIHNALLTNKGTTKQEIANICGSGTNVCSKNAKEQFLADIIITEEKLNNAYGKLCRYGVINIECANNLGFMTDRKVTSDSNTCEVASGFYNKEWSADEYRDEYMSKFVTLNSPTGTYRPSRMAIWTTTAEPEYGDKGKSGSQHELLAACDHSLTQLTDPAKPASRIKVTAGVGTFSGTNLNDKGKWLLTSNKAYFLKDQKKPVRVLFSNGQNIVFGCKDAACKADPKLPIFMDGSDKILCKQVVALATGSSKDDVASSCDSLQSLDQVTTDSNVYLQQFDKRVQKGVKVFAKTNPDFKDAAIKFNELADDEQRKSILLGLQSCVDSGLLAKDLYASFNTQSTATSVTFKVINSMPKTVK